MEKETCMKCGGYRSRRKWGKEKDVLNQQRSYHPIGFAVFLDLLFSYIPFINDDMKRLGLDPNQLSYHEFQSSCYCIPAQQNLLCTTEEY